jgi:hypothetical protein
MTGKGSPQAGAVGAPGNEAGGAPGAGDRDHAGGPPGTRGRALAAWLGAACLSASAILIKLADTGPATAAFYRCSSPCRC